MYASSLAGQTLLEKESGHSGQSFVTAASICAALIKSISMIIRRGGERLTPKTRGGGF